MAAPVNRNLVSNVTLIIRIQAEYSAGTQTVILRCLLETAATGQHRNFSDRDALLAAIQDEISALQAHMLRRQAELERGADETA